jgi:hypothetical protein
MQRHKTQNCFVALKKDIVTWRRIDELRFEKKSREKRIHSAGVLVGALSLGRNKKESCHITPEAHSDCCNALCRPG